jgi:RNA recognition motif. (a.k.a. RRM, RBD, or RNP domain)
MEKTVCIDGLPRWVSETHLRELCHVYGDVVSARVVKDAYGISMGYAFVQMGSMQSAEKLIAGLTDFRPFGAPLYVARTYPVGAT